MLLAWSLTEVVRYSYFVTYVAGFEDRTLTWLRYTMFFVLYPVGVTSEVYLAYSAIGPAAAVHWLYPMFIWFVLMTYVPSELPPLRRYISF